MFKEQFRRAYLASLDHYRAFYDDISEYGRAEGAGHCLYFIPGINGTPGQIRFAFPSLLRRFGREMYVRGCYLPEFSARRAVWEKYRPESVAAKRAQVRRDLTELLERFPHVWIVASSNGFYDLLAAASGLPSGWESRATLLWVACAPDRFEVSPWVETFSRWSGFRENGHLWAAVPNHNWLKWMNPETSTHLSWRLGEQWRLYHKEDLESRFHLFGVRWVYTSPECFNACLASATEGAGALGLRSFVLAASRDGYWYGKPREALELTVARYLTRREIFHRPSSHLWVVTPEHLTAFLSRVTDP